MNVRKAVMCVMALFAIMMGLSVVAGDPKKDIDASAELAYKTNLCYEIGQLTEKAFVAISRNRDYSAIDRFVSKVDALTGGGYRIDERAHEAFLDLLKRLVDFQCDDQEVKMCVYEAQKYLVSRMLPLDGDTTHLSERMRCMMAERFKEFLRYLDGRIITDFELKPVYLNVGPPIEAIVASTNVFIGFNPEAVSDPQVQQIWEKEIEENNKNAMMNKEQIELSRMKELYGAWVIEAINALSKDDGNGHRDESAGRGTDAGCKLDGVVLTDSLDVGKNVGRPRSRVKHE